MTWGESALKEDVERYMLNSTSIAIGGVGQQMVVGDGRGYDVGRFTRMWRWIFENGQVLEMNVYAEMDEYRMHRHIYGNINNGTGEADGVK